MGLLKKIIPLILVVIAGVAIAIFILNQEKSVIKDPHDHESGHEEHEVVGEHKDHEEKDRDHGEDEEHSQHETHESHNNGDEHEHHEGHSDAGDQGRSEEGIGNDDHSAHGEAITMNSESIKLSNIELLTAGKTHFKKSLLMSGIVSPNRDALAKISPRFPGIIKSLRKNLGDVVKVGDTIAFVESNESLSSYSLLAEMAGTVIEKNVSVGEFVDTEKHLYTIVNLTTVWVEFNVHREDYPSLELGQKVELTWDDKNDVMTGKITYLSPVGNEATQTLLARLTLPNKNHKLQLGLFVRGEAILESTTLPLGVNINALQTVEGKEVVFVREDNRFEARQVKIGRRNKNVIEILEGLTAGEIYASKNSFILKADLGKSEAKHEH